MRAQGAALLPLLAAAAAADFFAHFFYRSLENVAELM